LSKRDYNPYAAPSVDDEQPPESARERVNPELATLMQRLVAHLVDVAILAGVAVLSLVYWQATMDHSYYTPPYGAGEELGRFAGFMVPWVLTAIGQWALISFTGQSIGKRFAGIRIVRLRGSKPGSVYGVLLRAWVPWGAHFFATFLVPPAGFVLPLVDALFVFRADRRTLRDHVAATKVIQVRQ
jgi:uncharacterized RDD family membrane protein YckC